MIVGKQLSLQHMHSFVFILDLHGKRTFQRRGIRKSGQFLQQLQTFLIALFHCQKIHQKNTGKLLFL